MTAWTQTAVATFTATIGVMFVLWALSVRRRDASIVDIYWGPGFALIAWLAWWINGAAAGRPLAVALLATLWGGRLGVYLWWRNSGAGEDARYAAMRRRHGDRFAVVSLYTVFGLQAVLMWIVSLPLQAVPLAGALVPLGALDALGALLFAVGFTFESVGDWQLARFRADPANRGAVMQRGLWAWTRHPNYFGDFTVWWGFACFATAAGAWWTVIGPVVMSVLLLRVSGVTLLERSLRRSKPAYADYAARTPAFFPRPPAFFPRPPRRAP